MYLASDSVIYSDIARVISLFIRIIYYTCTGPILYILESVINLLSIL